MVDFIDEIGNSTLHESYERDLAKIYNYCTFLQQPLELWMFVPCDENGDVLEAVPYYADGIEKVNEYKKAKERCLFEGFKSVPFSNSVKKGKYIIDFNYTENINIESLLHHDIVFELTQVALKQLSSFGYKVAQAGI